MGGLLSPCSCQPKEPGVSQGWSLRSSLSSLCRETFVPLPVKCVPARFLQLFSSASYFMISKFVMLPIPTQYRLSSVDLQVYLEKLQAAQCTNPKPWPWECKINPMVTLSIFQVNNIAEVVVFWRAQPWSSEQKASMAGLFWRVRIWLTIYKDL